MRFPFGGESGSPDFLKFGEVMVCTYKDFRS